MSKQPRLGNNPLAWLTSTTTEKVEAAIKSEIVEKVDNAEAPKKANAKNDETVKKVKAKNTESTEKVKAKHDEASTPAVKEKASGAKKLVLNKRTQKASPSILVETPARQQQPFEEENNQQAVIKSIPHAFYFLPFSAKTKEALGRRLQDLLSWIEKEGSNEQIEDIAYTLLMGRSHFNQRSAILVSDIDELKSSLQTILQTGSAPRYVTKPEQKLKAAYEATTVIRGNEWLQQLANGEESAEEQESVLLQIAELYVNGAALNWNLMYKNKGKRISLPTYPFAKERFWLPEDVRKPSFINMQSVLHSSPADAATETVLYGIDWVDAPLEAAEHSSFNRVLVMEAGDGYSSHVRQKLQSITGLTIDVMTVLPGNSYSDLGNGVIRIRTDAAEDYIRLFESLKAQNRLPELLLNFWPFTILDGDRKSQLAIGVYVYFYLIRTLHQLSIQTLKRILHIYPSDHPNSATYHEAVGGYSRSLQMVQPQLQLTVIGAQQNKVEDLIELSIQEALTPFRDMDLEVRYANKLRTVRKAKTIPMNTYGLDMLKQQGVYLITGGTGGLGLLFAEELAVQYKARLALIGRSELDAKRQLKIDALRGLGADVIYIQGDVGSRTDLTKAVETVRKRWGRVNGVLHAAGQMDGELVLHKLEEKFASILQPKIEGTVLLDELTADEELDFFVLFSSTSAYLGDIGQCDYSIGNRFLDSYAAFREELRSQGKRSGQTVSVNWPIWRDGGMHLSKEAEELYLQSSGMSYLEKEAGLRAFSQLLSSGRCQGMVLAGNRRRMERFLQMEEEETCTEASIMQSSQHNDTWQQDLAADSVRSTSAETPVDSGANGESMIGTETKLLFDLKQIAADYVKMSPEKMDLEENLGNYGFDSIDLKKLAKQLSDHYRISVSPTVFFAHSSLQSISEHLLDSFGGSILMHYSRLEPAAAHTPNQPALHQAAAPAQKNSFFQPVAAAVSSAPDFQPVKEPVQSFTPSVGGSSREPVAIIGVNGIFPQSNGLDEFWQNLKAEKDLITEIPGDRWNYRDFYKEGGPAKGKQNTKWGGFISDADKFDPSFFHISPREAEMIDPQHRLFLESVWKTIENAGYRSSSLEGRNIGVFVGAQFTDYHQLLDQQGIFHANVATGNAHTMLPNRVSYLMNWHGPSESIDTACSSSLVAVHRAVKSIQSGESELAVAGGVSLMLNPQTMTTISQLGVLSPEGRCRTFDTRANGYVRGEGVGSILLKPLSKAQADGDHIYAVIKGSAENHGGKANSLTAPNSEAQASVLLRAYEEAGVDPEHITYIETHGTGTELGDPVEIEGLKKAFRDLYKRRGQTPAKRNYCGLSSLKTNIGHLEPASGIAGILKIVLAIQHQTLPGTVHFEQKNPYIEIDDSPFYIIDKTRSWTTGLDAAGRTIPRVAAVSSFGFGGTNAHIVIEEFSHAALSVPSNEPQVIVLSAKTEERLKAYAADLCQFLIPCKDAAMDPVLPKHYVRELLRGDLANELSGLIHVQAQEIEAFEAFEELVGTDSMVMEHFCRIVSSRYGFDVQVDWLAECSSLDKLAGRLMAEHQASIHAYYNKGLQLLDEKEAVSESSESDYSLADLAYTLQTGREAMDERLAIVASTIEELTEKLSAYVQDRTDEQTVLRGNITGKTRLSFLDGEAGKQFIAMVQQNREMNKLAELWTLGIDFNWQLIHRGQNPKRVPAPTYPFARERYWLPNASGKKENAAAARLHPLLERNASTFHEQKFTTTLRGNEFYVADHTVAGRQVLPGVAILEMARKAGELATQSSVYKLGNMMWAQPVEVISGSQQEINMSLYINEADQVEFELYTISVDDRVIHAQGMLQTSEEQEVLQVEEFLDLKELRNRLHGQMSGEACYQWFKEIGLDYGPSFRIVQELWHEGHEALSMLHLPVHLQGDFNEWGLHPSLLDGALHTISSLQDSREPQTLSLPFALGEIEILQPLVSVCFAYMKLTAADGRMKKYDITITDEMGRVLVQMKQFAVKPIRSNEQDQRDQLLKLFQKLQDGDLAVNEVEQLTRRFA